MTFKYLGPFAVYSIPNNLLSVDKKEAAESYLMQYFGYGKITVGFSFVVNRVQ